jgi:hypothetical protein
MFVDLPLSRSCLAGTDDSNAVSGCGGHDEEYPKLPRKTNQDESIRVLLVRRAEG